MKRFMKYAAMIAMALCATQMTSCSSDDNDGAVTPEFSITYDEGLTVTTSGGPTAIDDVTIEYYAGDNTIVITGFTFSPMMPSFGVLSVKVTEQESNGLTVFALDGTQTTLYGEMDTLYGEVIDGEINLSFNVASGMGETTTDYPATFNGSISTKSGNFAPEFSSDLYDEGLYVTTSNGPTKIDNVEVTYYEGNQTLVVDGFTFAPAMGAILGVMSIPNVSVVEAVNGLVTLSVDADQTTNYGTVTALNGEVITGKINLSFNVASGMGETTTDYPATFYGDITLNEDSYVEVTE